MIKVLHVLAALNDGGIESMLKSYYEYFDSNNIQFDFIVFEKDKGILEDFFTSKGSKIYHISPKRDSFIKSNNELKMIIKNGKYDIIHCHQNRSNIFPLYYAKKYKIKNRISHAHNAMPLNSLKEKLLKSICSYLIEKYSTELFACSKLASSWLYSKKSQKKVVIINNAINLENFRYNKDVRKSIRQKYNLSEKIVLGCVARLHPHKNHVFLVDIFYELHKNNDKFVLFLAGSGPNETMLKEKVKKLGLEDNVIFAGVCKNVNELLQGFDIFILPSLYEGLGISFIEAQTSGLITIASKEPIPIETNVTPNIHYISLKKSAKEWADYIESIYINDYERMDYISQISKKGFDIISESKKLENKYNAMVNNNE